MILGITYSFQSSRALVNYRSYLQNSLIYPFFIIIELPRYIICLGLTLIAISLALFFSLLQFLILILKPQVMSVSLVSFRFALYYASSFSYSYIIIKLLIQLGIYNIVVYIKQKVTIKIGGLCTVAGQRYTSITLVLDIVRGQLLERQKVG